MEFSNNYIGINPPLENLENKDSLDVIVNMGPNTPVLMVYSGWFCGLTEKSLQKRATYRIPPQRIGKTL
ncbi:MAG: hypothetical protein CM1200mP7_1370 [Chloroflexota bacterium]|nr:MAG: hypothetical protein CM1200mP7_1370 [Chloroflexota bacterium]